MIHIRGARDEDGPEWLRMRRALWDDCPDNQPGREIDGIVGKDLEVFFAKRSGVGLCGFLEASVRPRADGCEAMPVGYIEGWYVDPDVRRRGIGRVLVETAERWASSKRPTGS
jgi:aminoglycoside 6'-N-acetyltransferase I